ncbi:LysE family transporter [Sphingosinicella sp. LHD-64]|uniref:LysE family translocator n=1 Tax=Sphingosinicella sp. LHD-64 TaxID=3072139 RepID=UPI00280D9C5A|nr:LysE family transporter [Sphingosinicella sp. LHD-64]MDQ8756753.1 LysE family transporter [Sphingosinicella sp. LHD-64]
MESIPALLLVFAGFWLMQVAIPGPNFVRISEATFAHSRAIAMRTAAGTAAANCTWCLIAIAGAAVLAQDRVFGPAMRIAGALYFAAYGYQLIHRALRRRPSRATGTDALTAFRAGYLTAIASPQAGLFFASVLTTMFPPVLGGTLIAALVAIVGVVSLGWYAVVTALLAAPASRRWYERQRPAIELLFGALLLVASFNLVNASLELV